MTIYCSTCSKGVQLSSGDQAHYQRGQQAAQANKKRVVVICAQCHWTSLAPCA